VTSVCPGVVESELANTISDLVAREAMRTFRQIALQPEAIANAVSRSRTTSTPLESWYGPGQAHFNRDRRGQPRQHTQAT
jgi:hypothetical protein